ncbi:MAG: hypothetical protein KM312_08540 [Hydrogenibacillus schlegelii]|uniref:Uncharacterized protein n=1 Tax=Hydrogenibacillus schlegelii TaxID=1484 RepID=A0A947CWB9_HYDSH|nr:hypothetical protein [Hydrogenibacillus schlegelii]MBT9282674.1 hypothetical protein [Hydrogenibacillus schlegelii]
MSKYELENAEFHTLGFFRQPRPKAGFVWVDNFDWAKNLRYGGWVPSIDVLALKASKLFRDEGGPYVALFGLETFMHRLTVNVLNGEPPDFETAAKEDGPYLLPRALVDSGGMDDGEWERTAPLEERPTLFLEFAKLKANNPEALLTFAKRWGALRPMSAGYRLFVERKTETLIFPIETMQDWQKEIQNMKRLVKLWGMLKEAEEMEYDKELKQHFSWDKARKRIYYEYVAENWSWSTTVTFNEIEYESIREGDYVAAARYLLMKEINFKLSENKVRFQLLWDRKKRNAKPHAVAVNLLGAMYYQFYEAVRDKRHFKQCIVCGKWEAVDRATWRYHPSCGSTYRSRKRRGIEAIRSGKKTVEQVAEELGVAVDEVQMWLEEKN